MPKQTIPAGGFEASASGGLHKSSMGDTYPWTVQPRITIMPGGDAVTVWVAFNALTGEEIGRFIKWEDAALAIECELGLEALARDGGEA